MRHEIPGGETTAVVFGDHPDAGEMGLIHAMLRLSAFRDLPVRIMPDHHAGRGCVIGFTCPIDRSNPVVIPNLVGVDIGCGVSAIRLPNKIQLKRGEDFLAFDRYLREQVPSGFAIRDSAYLDLFKVFERHFPGWSVEDFTGQVNNLAARIKFDTRRLWPSLGTLGGGNHFIELDKDPSSQDPRLWLVVHSGSRQFGLKVCEYHQRIADKQHGSAKGLAWLEKDEARAYLADMGIAQRYAMWNRLVILDILQRFWGLAGHERFALPLTSVHNYIDDEWVIRKGAISAKLGEPIIIPWNMRDGIILGLGKGSPDWNQSAPHGAGRRMSRGEAKRSLTAAAFTKAMEAADIWTSSANQSTLDEAPEAYKPSAAVEAEIGDTVEITAHLRPVYNFKASTR